MSATAEPLHGRAADEIGQQLREHLAQLDEITGPVGEYLAVIVEALDAPFAAHDTRARQALLDERLGWVMASLRGLTDAKDRHLRDVTFDVGYLRRKIEETPVTYDVYRAPDDRGDQ